MFETRLAWALLLVTGLAAFRTAEANTLVVDAAGGGAFTDIPAAVAAAQPFDVIVVQPGTYSGFAVSSNITVLGLGPNVRVGSGTRVHAVAGGQRVVLAALVLADLRINNCAGAVVLDGLDVGGTTLPSTFSQSIEVNQCADVRAIQCSFGAPNAIHLRGAHVTASRVEFVQCDVAGGTGLLADCGFPFNGVEALFATGSSRVHLASTVVLGGEGGGVTSTCGSGCNLGAGSGGAGAWVTAQSELLVMGRSTQHVEGGGEGDGGDCACDGSAGAGFLIDAAFARWSGCTPLGGHQFCPFGSTGRPFVTLNGGTATQESALSPFLERVGIPAPGQVVQFDVHALPGDVVELRVGRGTALNPIPGVQIEELTTVLRIFQMGTIGASGVASLSLLPPAGFPHGFDFHAQAVVLRAGQELRTNSTPVVLR